MANTYFANVGDVLKHLLLLEVLGHERPSVYLESHAGSAVYRLGGVDSAFLDARHFLARSGTDGRLANCDYTRVLREWVAGRSEYPGSAMLAFLTLGRAALYRLWDLDGGSETDLRDAATRLGLDAQVAVRRGDGLADVIHDSSPGRRLILLDPYGVHARHEGGPSAVTAFATLVQRGDVVLLWYSVRAPNQRLVWPSKLEADLGLKLWRGELRLPGPAANRAGLAGCGLLAANLGSESRAGAARLLRALESLARSEVASNGGGEVTCVINDPDDVSVAESQGERRRSR